MGLYLPEELRWLGWVAGSTWPDGDETRMWEIAAAWQHAATELRSLLPEIDGAKNATMAAYPAGAGRAAMGAKFDELRTGDQSLETLAGLFETISNSTFDTGTELEATKLTIIVSLVWLALEILWAWVFPPTAPAAEAAAITTTRSFLRVLEDRLAAQIQNLAKRLGAATEKRYFFKSVAQQRRFVLPTAKGWGVYGVKFLESGLTSMALDASVQFGQMAAGHRRNFDGRQFGISALASLAGTLPSREFARYLGFGLDKAFGKQIAGVWGGSTMRGAFIGASAGVVSSVMGNVAVGAATGSWSSFSSPAGWVGGMARGGLVGGARGGFSMNTVSKTDIRRFAWADKPTKAAAPLATRPVAAIDNSRSGDGSASVPPGAGVHTAAAGDGHSSVGSRSSDSRSFVTARETDSGSHVSPRASDSHGSARNSDSGSYVSTRDSDGSFVTARTGSGGEEAQPGTRGSGGTEPPTSWSSSVDGGWNPTAPGSHGSTSAPAANAGGATPQQAGPSPVAQAPSNASQQPNSAVSRPSGPLEQPAARPTPQTPSGASAAGVGSNTPVPHAGSRPPSAGGDGSPQHGGRDESSKPFLAPGKDLKSKTRPKLIVDWGPMPAGFEAPTAPAAPDWLPPEPEPEPTEQAPDVDVALRLNADSR